MVWVEQQHAYFWMLQERIPSQNDSCSLPLLSCLCLHACGLHTTVNAAVALASPQHIMTLHWLQVSAADIGAFNRHLETQ